ncbi:MAG: MMPL family transporter, partial [Fuerstiella sp.]|nr:MMPL family transporter [Fuerstiella sp.]
MLFRQLGHITSRHPSVVIGIWIVLLIATFLQAPKWESVVENGEFAFLPRDSPSVVAEELFRRTFPDHSVSSSVVLVLRREARREGLLDEDYEFIRQVVVPGLRKTIGFSEGQDEHEEDSSSADQSLVRKLSWRETPHNGRLYDSPDGKASLVVLELKSEFLDEGNAVLIADVERFLTERRHIPTSKTPSSDPTRMSIPQGLDIAFSGTATFGRDIIREAKNSAESTETWTVILVIFLLLIMYRAP